jgi:hypothetical protein
MTNLFVHRRLDRLLAERAALGTTLDDRCAKLLRRLREQCPQAVPPPKPEPGGLSDPVVVETRDLERLVRTALHAEADDGLVLLVDGESELLVDPSRTRVLTGEGVVLVVLGVECDQTGAVEVTIPFAAGTEDARTSSPSPWSPPPTTTTRSPASSRRHSPSSAPTAGRWPSGCSWSPDMQEPGTARIG